jgi:hypothetical protein
MRSPRGRRSLAFVVGASLVLGLFAPTGVAAGATGPSTPAATGKCAHVPSAESALIHGRLTACGNSLIDGRGHRVRLRTYEFVGMLPGNGEVPTNCLHWQRMPSTLPSHLRQQGFNSAFLMLSWANLEPTPPTKKPDGSLVHHGNISYLRAVDATIKNLAAHGIASVLGLVQWKWSPAFTNLDLGGGLTTPCGQGMPKWLYPHGGGIKRMAQAELRFYQGQDGKARAGFLNAWKLIARRYAKTNSVVGCVLFWEAYDLIAQPYLGHTVSPSTLRLAQWYETIGKTIRGFAPSMMLIAPDWHSRGKVYFALGRRPRLSNIALGFEYYASRWDSSARARLAVYLRRATSWHVPAWISENNAFGHTTSPRGAPQNPRWASDTNKLMAHAKSVRLGWCIIGRVDAALAKILVRWGA